RRVEIRDPRQIEVNTIGRACHDGDELSFEIVGGRKIELAFEREHVYVAVDALVGPPSPGHVPPARVAPTDPAVTHERIAKSRARRQAVTSRPTATDRYDRVL